MELWTKRFRLGKTSSLKALIKEAESELDVTSIMLAREQVLVIGIFKKIFFGREALQCEISSVLNILVLPMLNID